MASTQPCDHTSVGIVVLREGQLLLIDRKRPPLGLAAPAGHVDKHGKPNMTPAQRYEAAARAELFEETGLIAGPLQLVFDGRKDNPCRRPDGTWHHWKVFLATETKGTLKPSTAETRGAFWCTKDNMMDLLNGAPIPTPTGPPCGLEPVWKELFSDVSVLKLFPRLR